MFTAATKNTEDKTKDTVDDVREGARRVRDDLRTAASAVREDIEDLAHQAGRSARQIAADAEESLATKVRRNPEVSLLVAAGVGFILGALVRGK